MSLILEALRKLERERPSKERGFLVVAAQAWPARGRSSGLWVALTVLASAAFAAGVAFFALRQPAVRQPAAASSSPKTPVPFASPLTPPAPLPPPARPVVARDTEPQKPAPAPSVEAVTAGAANPSPPADLVLQAISERDGEPIAIVSGHLVRVGDAFSGVKVLRIGEGEVEVESGGRHIVLHF